MRASTRLPCIVACVVPLLALAPRGIDAQRLSPAETVERYLTAKEHQSWAEAAKYLDLNALVMRRDSALKFAAEPVRERRLTPEQLMKHDSTMPRVVAEYQVRKMEEALKSSRLEHAWDFEFADVADSSKLRKMTPLELGASWVRAHDIRYMMLVMSRSVPGCDTASLAGVISETLLPAPSHWLIGSVLRDSIAYVLTKDPWWMQADSARKKLDLEFPPEVISLRKVSGQWKIYPREASNRGMMIGGSCATADEDEGQP